MNKANKDFFQIFFVKFRVLKLRFLAFPEGPGGFRELREAHRNHFHLSWYLSVAGVTSYGINKNIYYLIFNFSSGTLFLKNLV